MSEPQTTPADAIAVDPVAVEPVAVDPASPAAPPLAQPGESGAPISTVPETSTAFEGTRRRRLVALAGLGRVARFMVMVALFGVGVALGYANFRLGQAAVPTNSSAQTSGMEPPASVQAMVQALQVNDLDAVRSSVAAIRDESGAVVVDPYRWLAGELGSMRLREVSQVETLETFIDGPRTATGLIISGLTTGGAEVSWHLIVQTTNGQIVTFR